MKKAKDLNKTELQVLNAMSLVCKKWHADMHEINTPSIEVEHTLEGIRMNGDGRRATLLTAAKGFNTDFSGTIAASIATYKEVARDFKKMATLFYTSFKICPECKGEQGEGTSGKHEEHGWPAEECWHDCSDCAGKGYVERNNHA